MGKIDWVRKLTTKNKTSAMRVVMLLMCLSILLTPQPSLAAMAEPIIIYEDPDLIGNIEEDMSEVVTAPTDNETPTELIWLYHALYSCFVYNWSNYWFVDKAQSHDGTRDATETAASLFRWSQHQQLGIARIVQRKTGYL